MLEVLHIIIVVTVIVHCAALPWAIRQCTCVTTVTCIELLVMYQLIVILGLLLGVTVMYEAAHRTGIEVTGDLSLDVAV